jgi:transmembrane sensor
MSKAREIEERAALWVLRQEEPYWSAEEQEELDRWLAQSDAHKAAFWRLQHGWRDADRIASVGELSLAPDRRVTPGSWWKPLALAATLLLVATVFTLRGPGLPFVGTEQVQTAAFETAIGGHKIVNLPDGSRVELNTDTAIKAALSEHRRAIWLERGEAYFEVAKHAGQEFVIFAGPRTVTVIGTKFSVRRDGASLAVAVVEGRVRLDEGSGDSLRSTILTAGQIAQAADRITTVSADSAEAVAERLAWRGGRLLFDEATLAEAASEFNRYNRKSLIIQGAAAGQVRIGGSFEARNVDGFARLLKDAYGLKVRSADDKILVSS